MSRSWRRLFNRTRTLLNPPCLGGTFLFYSHTDLVDRTDLFATDFLRSLLLASQSNRVQLASLVEEIIQN